MTIKQEILISSTNQRKSCPEFDSQLPARFSLSFHLDEMVTGCVNSILGPKLRRVLN